MTIREVAEILAAAEGATTAMSREDTTRTTDTMMDATATALATAEAARITEAGSSSSSNSLEGGQTGATQADEVRSAVLAHIISPSQLPSASSAIGALDCVCNAVKGTRDFLRRQNTC